MFNETSKAVITWPFGPKLAQYSGSIWTRFVSRMKRTPGFAMYSWKSVNRCLNLFTRFFTRISVTSGPYCLWSKRWNWTSTQLNIGSEANSGYGWHVSASSRASISSDNLGQLAPLSRRWARCARVSTILVNYKQQKEKQSVYNQQIQFNIKTPKFHNV